MSSFVAASLDCTGASTATERINHTLFKRFGGTGYPYLVMVTHDGIVLNTIGGYVKPKQFAAELVKATRSVSTQACPHCMTEGHSEDAKFCRVCGERL